MALPATLVRVRRARPADVGLLLPLFEAYRRFYGRRPGPAAARRFLAARLKRGESVVFLAFDGSEPVGFTQLFPTFSSTSMKRLWILNDLFVDPSARRRGVAEALMARSARLAKETGAEGLVLETAVDNRAAQALYRKLGWELDREFLRFGLDA